jgi:hypothetical protein
MIVEYVTVISRYLERGFKKRGIMFTGLEITADHQ